MDGRNRRYYELTEDGRSRLAAEADRLRSLAEAATERLVAARRRRAAAGRPTANPA